MMLGKKGEFRSRLLRSFVSLPHIHIGQHWYPDPRSRWCIVMSSRFSDVQELARHEMEGLASQHQHGTLTARRMVRSLV